MRSPSDNKHGPTGVRLTKPIIESIIAALNAALAGDGFDGGDFDGLNREDFAHALDWAISRRADMERA